MATKLEEARALLANRLDEVERERRQLREAIGQLDGLIKTESRSERAAPSTSRRRSRRGGASRSSSRQSSKRPGAKRGAKRARRGERERQLMKSIKAHPDFRVSEHAREVGVSPQQLYPLLNRLMAQQKIVKKDSRYTVTS